MRRVPDEGSHIPPVRGEDEEERQDERGQDAVEACALRLERGRALARRKVVVVRQGLWDKKCAICLACDNR